MQDYSCVVISFSCKINMQDYSCVVISFSFKINMQDYSCVVITISCVIKSGLPGAQGVHPCLWCWTTKDRIQNPPQQCIPSEERTLTSLKADSQCFQAQGKGNTSNVEFCNNVSSEPVLVISRSCVCVCPPYLHILLY